MGSDEAEPFERPHILLMLLEDIPEEFVSAAQSRLRHPGLTLRIARHSGTYAGIERCLPTAVALFVAAGFFNGFLQEAGKEGYEAFKAGATGLWGRAKALKVRVLGTARKVSAGGRYSLEYSITGEIAPRLNFKLLLKTEIDESDAEAGIAAFLDLIADIHANRLGEADLKALLSYRPVWGRGSSNL